MKKEYMAPDLYFESFVLSESIAAGCTASSETTSAVLATGYFGSTSGVTCETQYDGSFEIEGYCYWNGSTKVFLS